MYKKFLVFISVLAIAYTSKAQVHVQDSLALVTLYESTNSANWYDKWDLSQPVNTWHGVTVSGGRVTELLLGYNQLSGSIPGELGKLTNLTRLDLEFNQLSGSIPGELGNLTNLTRLDLESNQLSGSIPGELGKLTNLTRLDLESNQLSGSIPGELGKLINLRYLYLRFNQLSGSIPGELGKLISLIELDLEFNQLSGNIPWELRKLVYLRYLYLEFNQLSGSIPRGLGRLNDLTGLDLSNNQLSGNIPMEFGKLTNLAWLDLSNNQLHGSIPMEFGKLINLRWLYLSNNQLHGSIPMELTNLINLTELDLSNNQLHGSIPIEFTNLINLRYLYLYDNQFDELPDLSSLTSLITFQVHNNRLDFGDILPNINVLNGYSPQFIREGICYNISIRDELILSVQVDGTNNVYQWFKDNTILFSATDDTLKLSNIQTTDHGLYHCEVTNPNVPNLTLISIPDTVMQKMNNAPRINNTPTDIGLSSTTIEENKLIGTMIGILSTTDPDARDSHTYNLSGTNAHSFQIIEDTLKGATAFNYETKSSYTITIQTEDAGGEIFSKNFTIMVNDINENPTDITLSNTIIEENKVIGSLIGVLSTTDPDASDDHTYNLLGTDANSFQIIEDTLKSAVAFDYEAKNSYTITIQTQDAGGLTYQKDFTISIDEFTALDELDISNEVTIYPNPSRKNVIIEINNHLSDKGSIKVYSLNGKNERSFPFEKNSVKQIFIFTIADLPSGIYILHGEIGDYYFTERIFKK